MAKGESKRVSQRRVDVDDASAHTGETLSADERRYRMVLATIPSSVLLIDPHLEILAATDFCGRKAMPRVTGVTFSSP